MQHAYLVAWKYFPQPNKPTIDADIIRLQSKIESHDDFKPVIDKIMRLHPKVQRSGSVPLVLSFSYFGIEE